MQIDRPQLFYARDQEGSTNTLGDWPLLCEGDPDTFVGLAVWIKAMMEDRLHDTYRCTVCLADPKDKKKVIRLVDPGMQSLFHHRLNVKGYNFENAPFKVEKWDHASDQYRPLTIGFNLQVLAYLIYADKGGKYPFTDKEHTKQFLTFDTRVIICERKAHIQVSPYLVTKDGEKECLRITHSIVFDKVKITVPASMQPPAEDFVCSVCTEGIDPMDKIFNSACGTEIGHSFHRHCIEKWFATHRDGKRSCPECRTLITCAI